MAGIAGSPEHRGAFVEHPMDIVDTSMVDHVAYRQHVQPIADATPVTGRTGQPDCLLQQVLALLALAHLQQPPARSRRACASPSWSPLTRQSARPFSRHGRAVA